MKGDIRHRSRRLTYWDAEKGYSVTLLTNNFEMSGEDIIEIDRRRWQIGMLQADEAELSPKILLWGQRQCHQVSDMGHDDSEPPSSHSHVSLTPFCIINSQV